LIHPVLLHHMQFRLVSARLRVSMKRFRAEPMGDLG
jgi:hypothetical protein